MIIDTIRRSAQVKPQSLALIFHEGRNATPASLTWQELSLGIARTGTALSREFAPGARLLLIFPQGIEFCLAHLACHHAGIVPVPVPLPGGSDGGERLSSIVADCDAAGILTIASEVSALADAACGLKVIALEQLEATEIGEVAPPYSATPDDVAFIQYTSGSVSAPKGVVVTHGNLDANVRMMNEEHGQGGEVFLSWVPHFHDMGLVGNFYMAMHTGGPLHLMTADSFVRRPLSWLKLLAQCGATHTTVPHFALGLCTRLAHTLKPGEIDLSALRLLVDSSEPVEWEGLAEFERAFAPFGLAPGTVVPHYGLAECTVMVSYPTADRPRFLDIDREAFARGRIVPCADAARVQRVVNCGRGQLDCDFAIVDPATGARCAPDRVGEIWVTGSHVAQGYWGNAATTAASFGQRIAGEADAPLYLRTGDLGFVHDGDLYVTGRIKDVIIVRGQNYYARDIESLAERASPLVRTGRVVAIPLAHRGSETFGLIAEVQPKFDYRKDAQAFVTAFSGLLGERLGLAAHRIVLVRRNSLPRTTSGKIRRIDAASAYQAGELPVLFEYDATRFAMSEAERASFPGTGDRGLLRSWLVTRIAEATGLGEISDHEDLFALAIDSLSMTNLLIELEDLTGTSLLDEQFYGEPTLATLLDLLRAQAAHGGASEADPPPDQTGDRQAQAKLGKRSSIKAKIAWRARVVGPQLGALALPYGAGSRLLDAILRRRRARAWFSQPFAARLDALVEELAPEDTETLRRDMTRASSWVYWREHRMGDPATFARYVTVRGLDHIEQARANGQAVVLGLVHTRMKGLYKYIPALLEQPFSVIANLAADRAQFYGMGNLAAASGATGGRTVPAARVAQIHTARRTLAAGGTVGVFMDVYEGVGGITVPFLGRRRPVRPGMAELALDTGAVIIPVEQWLHDGGRITIEFKPPLAASGETREARLLSLMIAQAACLEAMWQTNPAQMDTEAIRNQLALPRL